MQTGQLYEDDILRYGILTGISTECLSLRAGPGKVY